MLAIEKSAGLGLKIESVLGHTYRYSYKMSSSYQEKKAEIVAEIKEAKKQVQFIGKMMDYKNPHVAFGEWEEVYSVQPVTETLWTEDTPLFKRGTTYYQTYGGGPEGGYFVKDVEEHDGVKIHWVYKVSRNWFNPWRYEKIPNAVLEYEPEDEMAGKTARCRVIEVYPLHESREISNRHVLWGNAIEIVKALRDGYSSTDSHYQHLCIGIILHHFAYMDRYLDLVPADSCPTYKSVLQTLDRKQRAEDGEGSESEAEESSDESDSGSDSESEEEVVCCKKKIKTSDIIRSSEGTNICKDCWTWR